MKRAIVLGLALCLWSSGALGDEDPLSAAEEALGKALTGIDKLAFIPIEATGTTEDLSGLEAALLESLAKVPGLAVMAPEDVTAKAGIEFAEDARGIASVAKKCESKAALFPRVVRSTEGLELTLMLVDAEAKVLLDQTTPLSGLPPGKNPPPATPEGPAAEGPGEEQPGTEPGLAPGNPPNSLPPGGEGPGASPTAGDFESRALSLGPRTRLVAGGAVAFAGAHVGVVLDTPASVREDWLILEGKGTPISEHRLAELAGRSNLVQRIEKEVHSLKTLRNVGIGLTLGGFVAAGVALPFFKSEDTSFSTAGGIISGTGLAVGVAGLVMWLTYGPQAEQAQSPYPSRHLITKEEAESMVSGYNESLRRELGIENPKASSQAAPPDAPHWRLSLVPNSHGGGSAVFGFTF